MKQQYAYAECYRILEVNPACSWDELRRAYKLQIQKWHPDKFADKSAEKAAATDKIKCITTAHQQLVVYYREHGKLPDSEPAVAPRNLPPPERKRTRTSTSAASSWSHQTKTGKKKSGIMPVLVAMIVIINVFWFFAPDDDFESLASYAKPSAVTVMSNPDSLPAQSMPSQTQTQADPVASTDDRFITYGSSIGEVISIQGAPTKDEGNTWYYDESELYFEDGKVIGWRHAPSSKLKTGIATKTH